MKNITYKDIVAQNRARYVAERRKAQKEKMLKAFIYLVVMFVIGIASYIGYSIWQEKERETEQKEAEERRLLAEQSALEREIKRKQEEELKAKREQERMERKLRYEEERIALEKKRTEEVRRIEQERLERERHYEEERLARQKHQEEERAERKRKCEEERLAWEKKQAEDRANQERLQKADKHETARLGSERDLVKNRQIERTKVRPKVSSKDDIKFFQLRTQMGGSVLEPLIEKCNRLYDSDIPSGGRNVKSAIMIKLAGNIGPVDYRQTIRTKTTTSYGSIGRFEGTTMWGTHVQGDVLGATKSTSTKVGAYKATVPAGFKAAFDKLQSLARKKHARACAEVGACIFVETTKGRIGLDDQGALKFFTKAAEYGDADGMFMLAFCLYYGIGTPMNKPKIGEAYEELLKLREILNNSEQPSVIRENISSGWINRKMREAQGFAR